MQYYVQSICDPLTEWLQQTCDPDGMAAVSDAETACSTLLVEVILLQRLVVIECVELHQALGLEPNSAVTDHVANVSPREIRIWCQLNKIQVHQELFAVGRSSEDCRRFPSKSSPGPCCGTRADVIIAVQVSQVHACEAVPISEAFFRKSSCLTILVPK